jgi:Spy/CpxP family protein refolding chaperone
MLAGLFQGITLTAPQQTKVDSIESAYRASRGDVTPGPGMSQADRQKMRESMRSEVTDLRTVLTSDQQSQFDQNVTTMRSQMKRPGGGGGGGAPPQ